MFLFSTECFLHTCLTKNQFSNTCTQSTPYRVLKEDMHRLNSGWFCAIQGFYPNDKRLPLFCPTSSLLPASLAISRIYWQKTYAKINYLLQVSPLVRFMQWCHIWTSMTVNYEVNGLGLSSQLTIKILLFYIMVMNVLKKQIWNLLFVAVYKPHLTLQENHRIKFKNQISN